MHAVLQMKPAEASKPSTWMRPLVFEGELPRSSTASASSLAFLTSELLRNHGPNSMMGKKLPVCGIFMHTVTIGRMAGTTQHITMISACISSCNLCQDDSALSQVRCEAQGFQEGVQVAGIGGLDGFAADVVRGDSIGRCRLHGGYMTTRNEKGHLGKWPNSLFLLVPPTRIERVALPLGGGCSIH